MSFKGVVLLLKGQPLGQPCYQAVAVAFGPADGYVLPARLENELLGLVGHGAQEKRASPLHGVEAGPFKDSWGSALLAFLMRAHGAALMSWCLRA